MSKISLDTCASCVALPKGLDTSITCQKCETVLAQVHNLKLELQRLQNENLQEKALVINKKQPTQVKQFETLQTEKSAPSDLMTSVPSIYSVNSRGEAMLLVRPEPERDMLLSNSKLVRDTLNTIINPDPQSHRASSGLRKYLLSTNTDRSGRSSKYPVNSTDLKNDKSNVVVKNLKILTKTGHKDHSMFQYYWYDYLPVYVGSRSAILSKYFPFDQMANYLYLIFRILTFVVVWNLALYKYVWTRKNFWEFDNLRETDYGYSLIYRWVI